MAEDNEVRAAVVAEKLAREGWGWLAVALDAGGWKTVFDIPDWQERMKRLSQEPDFPYQP